MFSADTPSQRAAVGRRWAVVKCLPVVFAVLGSYIWQVEHIYLVPISERENSDCCSA